MKKFKLIIIKEKMNIIAVTIDLSRTSIDLYKINSENKMFELLDYSKLNKEFIEKYTSLTTGLLEAEDIIESEDPDFMIELNAIGARIIDITNEPDMIIAPFPLFDNNDNEVSSFSSIHELNVINVLKSIRDTLRMNNIVLKADTSESIQEQSKPEDNSIDAMNKELEEYDHNCEDMSSLGIPAVALSGNKTICDEIDRIKSMKNRTSKRKYIRKQTKEGVEPLLFN